MASAASHPRTAITTAGLTRNPVCCRRGRACCGLIPATSATIRAARWRSLALVAVRSTIRFPYTFPERIMAAVESMFRTSFWAVPALSRVEPVTTSGPTSTSMARSAAALRADPGLQTTATAKAPRSRAAPSAPRTYGVDPLAARPTTTSRSPAPARCTARAPARASSSAPSTARRRATSPPAMVPCTCSGGEEKVGGHSDASRTPRRPLVPAPK